MRRWIGVLLVLALSAPAWAQQPATAALSGQVTDPQGALVAQAQVVASHKATNVSRTVHSNASGLYEVQGLQPGEYEVTVTAPKFTTQTRTVQVLVGQKATLNFSLTVEGPKTGVVVIDDANNYPMVETTGSVVDGVVESRRMENLPLNGRNFLELALLLPGNSPAPNFDPTKTNTIVISSAGQLGRGGNVTVDGADDNDDVVGGPLQNLPLDAVQEFQIATNRFSAELGRSGSSVVNIVTRAGTNQWHGSASFFERDSALGGLKTNFDRQQYAGSLGGPLKRDRAWFFTALEYRNQNGVAEVGRRDTATQTIVREFAPAPLHDLLFTTRGDVAISQRDSLSLRYSLQRWDDGSQSTLDRPLGSASQRQSSHNGFQAFVANWTRVFSPTLLNRVSFSENNFFNGIEPVAPGPQLTFPSIQDGASFRVPQATRQNRAQLSDTLSWTRGRHSFHLGGDFQRVDADFDLRVFQQGRIELVEDFPSFDRNNDGVINDQDLLFAVTLRSGFPDRPLLLPDADNNYIAPFFQDDIRVNSRLMLNLGLCWELDTDVKDVSRVDQLNPIILPFLHGTRHRDRDNFAPRVGFNWSSRGGRFSLHGGYGIYYDRITLEIQSLERGLDGRALPIEVRAGNVFFTDFITGLFLPGAPTLSNPFTGFILPGAGAAGINIIDNRMQNPMVQQFDLGVQWEFARDFALRVDGLHNLGTHFIMGRPVGTVFNPVVGGPDVVKNLESSVNTKYDGLLVNVQKRFRHHYQFNASYTLSKAFNYANDDQIPFSNGPIDPNNLRLEYGPAPNDQRHRFVFSGLTELPHGVKLSTIWTMASGVPMDILMPDGSMRVPLLERNAGGRQFHTGAELNAFIQQVNAAGGIGGVPLPLVPDNARFNDSFHSFDLRLAKVFKVGERAQIEGMAEAFNLFNISNILGVSNKSYSGFQNVLARDSNNPGNPGFLRSSSFGQPVSTAGGAFGSGGPRAFQLALRVSF